MAKDRIDSNSSQQSSYNLSLSYGSLGGPSPPDARLPLSVKPRLLPRMLVLVVIHGLTQQPLLESLSVSTNVLLDIG